MHAATVEDGSLIGMGAVLLDGVQVNCSSCPPAAVHHAGSDACQGASQVEKGAIVAAGALVLPGKRVPSGQVWAGSPAKFLRNMEEGEADFVLQSADNYAALGAVHAAENAKSFEQILVFCLTFKAAFCLSNWLMCSYVCRLTRPKGRTGSCGTLTMTRTWAWSATPLPGRSFIQQAIHDMLVRGRLRILPLLGTGYACTHQSR